MAVKHPVGSIANSYSKLRESLPDLEIDPRIYGPQAIDLLAEMAKTGPNFRQCASFLMEHDIPLYVTREAKGVGAGWHENVSGECWISIDRSIGFIHSLISIGHESLHLRQTIRIRCSVEGEYHAWRFAYRLREELTSAGTALPLTEDEQKLASMPDQPTREDLKAAQRLIQKMAGPDYLIGKAPLAARDWQTAVIVPVNKLINTFLGRGEQL